jgi:predicted DNA-binding transcriptional regulator AlpA
LCPYLNNTIFTVSLRLKQVERFLVSTNTYNPYNPVAAENRSLRVAKIGEISSIVKMAPSTIRAKMRAGEFPASVRLSYKLAVWNLDEVEAWFLEKLNTSPVYVPHTAVSNAEVANG